MDLVKRHVNHFMFCFDFFWGPRQAKFTVEPEHISNLFKPSPLCLCIRYHPCDRDE
jgi:hypothetical protein